MCFVTEIENSSQLQATGNIRVSGYFRNKAGYQKTIKHFFAVNINLTWHP